MTPSTLLVLIALILAVMAAFGVTLGHVALFPLAFGVYLLSLLIGPWFVQRRPG